MTVRRDFVHAGAAMHTQLRHLGGDRYLLQLGPRTHELRASRDANGAFRVTLDGILHVADCAPCGKSLQVRIGGRTWTLDTAVGRAKSGSDAVPGKVVEAPMTGTVTKVLVTSGQQVEKGQTLVILTAMKMEHRLTAGVSGKVLELQASEGVIVDAGALLVRIE